MSWHIEVTRRAEKELAGLPIRHRRRIARAIDTLQDDPRPVGAKKLNSSQDAWRLRVGQYRVLYTIKKTILTVRVIRIGHRRDIYRDLR